MPYEYDRSNKKMNHNDISQIKINSYVIGRMSTISFALECSIYGLLILFYYTRYIHFSFFIFPIKLLQISIS